MPTMANKAVCLEGDAVTHSNWDLDAHKTTGRIYIVLTKGLRICFTSSRLLDNGDMDC